jgi:hypothetical protein
MRLHRACIALADHDVVQDLVRELVFQDAQHNNGYRQRCHTSLLDLHINIT